MQSLTVRIIHCLTNTERGRDGAASGLLLLLMFSAAKLEQKSVSDCMSLDTSFYDLRLLDHR